jgi:hypothetical protein
LVELAAHWADLNHPDSQPPSTGKPMPGAEQARQLGGQGTPQVAEFAAAELGARMETTVGSARAVMADALDLRHVRREALTTRMEVRDLRRRAVAAGR